MSLRGYRRRIRLVDVGTDFTKSEMRIVPAIVNTAVAQAIFTASYKRTRGTYSPSLNPAGLQIFRLVVKDASGVFVLEARPVFGLRYRGGAE